MPDPLPSGAWLRPALKQLRAAHQDAKNGEHFTSAEGCPAPSRMSIAVKAEVPEMLREASENGGDIENSPDTTLLASVQPRESPDHLFSELLPSGSVQLASEGGPTSFNFSLLDSRSAACSRSTALNPLEPVMPRLTSEKRSGRLLWPPHWDSQWPQDVPAPTSPSPSTVARPETDLLGRPLPPIPPPQDLFAQAVLQQPSLVTGPRGRFSSTAGIKSLNLAAFGSKRDDDTQSTWTSKLFSPAVDASEETVPEGESGPQREQGGGVTSPAGPPRSATEQPHRRGQLSLHRMSTELEGLVQLAARIDALEAELKVDLPATPQRSYSPSLVASSDTSSPARAARARLLAQQAGELGSSVSASRPSLAARRSVQRLPPLLPTSTAAGSTFLAPPSDNSSPSVSSISIRSVPLPPIERGKDGFYRLPVSPHKVAKRTPFDDATNLSFPLPPHLDLTSPVLKSATASSCEGSQATPVTPSTFSHPSSPPPSSPPPPLPEFVSVFLESRFPYERATRAGDGNVVEASEDDLAGDAYPPRPAHDRGHNRRAESLPSAVVPPLALRYSLRQRTPTQASISKTRADKNSGSLSDSPADSKVKWTVRAAPGWSLRAERREEHDEGAVRTVDDRGRWRSLRDSRLVRLGAAVLAISGLLLVVGLAVGFARSRDAMGLAKCECLNGGKVRTTAAGDCVCQCRGMLGGTSCHLDGTCLDGLAQGIVDTAARASSLWPPAVNTTRLINSLRLYFDENASTSTGCAGQLALLAIPNLSFSQLPNRVNWLEAALLHMFAESESNSTVVRFRTFASRLDYTLFGDAPASKPNSNYQIMPAGYVWDLATLERSVPAVSWNSTVGGGAASTLTPASLLVLDNITSNAIAASRQRSTALAHFWNDTLGLPPGQLDLFRAAVQGAEIILPFDATTLAQGTYEDPALFPPVAACASGLSAPSRSGIDALESTVLGLPPLPSDGVFCSDRPRYGILNLLNLRLPFASVDKRPRLAQQALVLRPSDPLRARMSVHAGGTLLAGPFAAASSAPSAPNTIEHFGLLAPVASAIDHVLLDYLSLLLVPIARALVEYLLSNASSLPPAVNSLLSQQALPTFEVQLWGSVDLATDVRFAKSGFSMPMSSNGSSPLFFGSPAGSTFRSWALGANKSAPLPIAWSPTAESPTSANDTGQAEVEAVWAEAASQTLTTAAQVWRALTGANLTS